MITDHKLLVAIFKWNVVNLSHRLQRLIQCILQYSIKILYKARPQLFVADWLCNHNHGIGKEGEILAMGTSIYVIETWHEYASHNSRIGMNGIHR